MVMLAIKTDSVAADPPQPKTHAPLGSGKMGWRTIIRPAGRDYPREQIAAADVLTIRGGEPERSALVLAHVDGGEETLFRYLGTDEGRVRLAVLTEKKPPLRLSASRVEIVGTVVAMHRSYAR